MGRRRLIQLQHGVRGIPWLGIGVVAAPAVGLIASAFVFNRHRLAWLLLRSGILLWVVVAAFLLDDPSAPITRASPRSPTWWFWGRFAVGLPLLLPSIVSGYLWATDHPGVDPSGLAIQTTGAWLLVLSGSSVARRLGRRTPGNLVASMAALVALFLMIFPVRIRDIPVLPAPGDPNWGLGTLVWSVVGIVAIVGIAYAGWWRPSPALSFRGHRPHIPM